MDTKNLILFIVIFGGIFSFGLFFLAYHRWKKDMTAPEKTVNATVIDKRSSVPVRDFNSARYQTALYYITFRTEEGETIELQVSQADYKAILADAQIHLTYKGSRIVDFERIEA